MYQLRSILSPDEIFQRYSQESLMEFYLGIPVDFDMLVCSPLRDDRSPTAGFAYSKSGRLFFRDFSGHFYGDVFEVVKFRYGCEYIEALERISDDVINERITKSNVVYEGEKRRRSIKVTARKLDDYDVLYWSKYGITPELLTLGKVTGLKLAWVESSIVFRSSITNPGFLYVFAHGIKCYMPRHRVRFLANTLELQRLPLKETGKTCIITKSYKDVLTCYSLGYHAVAPQSESTPITEPQRKLVEERFEKSILLYDNDEPGILNGERESQRLGIPSFYLEGAKDISEYRQKYGREAAIDVLKQFTGDDPEYRDRKLYN